MNRVHVLVPFDGATPKTRLAGVLDRPERQQFARAMLRDVLDAIRATGGRPRVLSRTPLALSDVAVTVDDRSLSAAVNAQFRSGPTETAVVMADLPLVTASTLDRLFTQGGDVVLAYGMGGGTNALVSRHPDFRVDYHDGSYADHLANARAVGASVTELDSFRLSLDVDEPDDLADLLLYGSGAATDWLRARGFTVSDDDGRGAIQRTTTPAAGSPGARDGRVPEE